MCQGHVKETRSYLLSASSKVLSKLYQDEKQNCILVTPFKLENLSKHFHSNARDFAVLLMHRATVAKMIFYLEPNKKAEAVKLIEESSTTTALVEEVPRQLKRVELLSTVDIILKALVEDEEGVGVGARRWGAGQGMGWGQTLAEVASWSEIGLKLEGPNSRSAMGTTALPDGIKVWKRY
ncbi:hypothetical protein Tco_0553678 [Tanacetum coccineum]